ncbi:MAG: PadR family transcriptional regulator [Slackia sp.]|nr:PadR family transcriptional regulator [Slackia sp.]
MDAQMKRGFLEACVLATLCRGESYGYQIVKEVPDILGLTESTLYPLLKRLEAAGCIAARSAEHNGRLRKYYRTTDEGRSKLSEFLREKDEIAQVYRYIEAASNDCEATAFDKACGGAMCDADGLGAPASDDGTKGDSHE